MVFVRTSRRGLKDKVLALRVKGTKPEQERVQTVYGCKLGNKGTASAKDMSSVQGQREDDAFFLLQPSKDHWIIGHVLWTFTCAKCFQKM